MPSRLCPARLESALVRILTAPRPPADQEYFHQIPSLEAFCRIRSPLDLALLSTLHWRATRRDVALFSTGKPFHGYCRRAVQMGLKRLQAQGFLSRCGKYALRLQKGQGSPVRASFLGYAREEVTGEMALAVRLVAALAGEIGAGQRALKKALCVSDEVATLCSGLARKHGSLLSRLGTAPQGAVFILRSRRGTAPNRALHPPFFCPESCAHNDLTLKKNQSNEGKGSAMPLPGAIDLLEAMKRILPLGEVETVRNALRNLWSRTPLGYDALQFLRHGFDIWLSRGAGAVENVEGYLFLALSRRKPTAPTPALEAVLAKGRAKGAARAGEAATGRLLAEEEDAAATSAEVLWAEIEAIYPDFREWGPFRQAQLLMTLGENPRAGLSSHDPQRFLQRKTT